jgi:hypothetical protein
MKDVYVQSSRCNLTSLCLPIGGYEAQVHQPCPSRAPSTARSPHWQNTIRQRWEGVTSSSCCARRPDTDLNPKSSVESTELKKFAYQLLLALSNHHLSPHFFYYTKFNSFLFHLFISPSPVELSLSLSASASQPYVAVLTLKFLIALSSLRSFRTFFPHTCLPFVSTIIHHAEAASSLLLFGRQSMRVWFSSTPVHNKALPVRQLCRALYYCQL